MKKLGWILIAASSAAVVFACSSPPAATSDDDDDTQGDASDFTRDGSVYDSTPASDTTLGILRFSPDKSYSGFDGTHSFKVPVAVYDGADDLQVSLDDAAEGTLTPVKLVNPTKTGVTDSGRYYMVLIEKAGTFTLTATSGGQTVTSRITVSNYDAPRYAAGQARYNTTDNTDTRKACTQCHGSGSDKIDHSPAVLATATDEEVKAIITTGILNNFPIKINGVSGHRWDATDEELDGLVTYLRSLDPNGFTAP
jgi:mono/diheme cytochrome c family protein